MIKQNLRLYCGNCGYTKVYKPSERPIKCPKCGKIPTYFERRGFYLKDYMIKKAKYYMDIFKDFIYCFIIGISLCAILGLALYGLAKVLKIGVMALAEIIKYIL